MLRNLLIYRFTIFNMLALAAVWLAYDRGLVTYLFEHDDTRITMVIVALFAAASWATTSHILRTSRMLNTLKEAGAEGLSFMVHRSAHHKLRAKVAWLESASGWMVGLGLIGTVIGFTVALSGIDQASLAQASGVQASVGKLMEGMRIALNTTIAGAVLGMWNEVNFRMLRTAQETLLADLEDDR